MLHNSRLVVSLSNKTEKHDTDIHSKQRNESTNSR
jgi:hypothetical protein